MEIREDILKHISENATSMKATIGLSVKDPHLFAFIAHELCKQNELLTKLIDVLANQNKETTITKEIEVSKEDSKNTAKK